MYRIGGAFDLYGCHGTRYKTNSCVEGVHIYSYILVGDGRTQTEVTSIFSRSRTNPPRGGSTSHTAALFAEADRLITSLRSGNVAAVGRRSKHPKRKTEESNGQVPKRKCTPTATEQQRRVVVINYPGKEVEESTPLYDDDVVVDGFIRFLSSADETEVRAAIGDIIRKKKSRKVDFSDVSPDDFEFVMVANKKVRVPDGDVPFDAVSLNKAYRGIVYVRLTKEFKVSKPLLC